MEEINVFVGNSMEEIAKEAYFKVKKNNPVTFKINDVRVIMFIDE